MDREELQRRSMDLSLSILRLVRNLPFRVDTHIVGKQVLRSATSVASNYRAALRARSRAEFYSKLCIVVEEPDETYFWLEIMRRSGMTDEKEVVMLMQECMDLLKIFSVTRKTTQLNMIAHRESK